MHCCRLCFNVGFILLLIGLGHAHFGSHNSNGDDPDDASKPTEDGGKSSVPGKAVTASVDTASPSPSPGNKKLVHFDERSFLKYIFEKYGDGTGKITFEGFEHLLENLGLGDIIISDHALDAHKLSNGSFADLHADNHTSAAKPSAPKPGPVVEEPAQNHDHGVDHDHEHGHDHGNEVSADDGAVDGFVIFGADGRYHDHEHYMYSTTGHDHERIHYAHQHRGGEKGEVKKPSRLAASISGVGTELSSSPGVGSRTMEKGVGEFLGNSSSDDVGHLDVPKNHPCLSAGELYHVFGFEPGVHDLGEENFVKLCPALIYELETKRCRAPKKPKKSSKPRASQSEVWLYATSSVVGISLCGLCGVAIVPLMGRFFYGPLLQFLIALAIGTLTGDAFLHLLPQALTASCDSHDKSEGSDSTSGVVRTRRHALPGGGDSPGAGGHSHSHSHDTAAIFHMLLALGAMLFFFIVENSLPSFMAWREKRLARHKRAHEHGGAKVTWKPKRCDLKGHGLTSDQYRYDNQMVNHYMGDKLCKNPNEPDDSVVRRNDDGDTKPAFDVEFGTGAENIGVVEKRDFYHGHGDDEERGAMLTRDDQGTCKKPSYTFLSRVSLKPWDATAGVADEARPSASPLSHGSDPPGLSFLWGDDGFGAKSTTTAATCSDPADVERSLMDRLGREEGQCEIVACDNIPCSDKSCPQDSCVIVTEGACGGNRPDHCLVPPSNNNDGHLPCFQNHNDVKHHSHSHDGGFDSQCAGETLKHGDEDGGVSRRCSGKWSEGEHDRSMTAARKRYSLCSNGGGNGDVAGGPGIVLPVTACALANNSCGGGVKDFPCAALVPTKDRASTPCSFDKSVYADGAGGDDKDDDEYDGITSDEPDEKDVLKKDTGTHHHHRHHHHHHHHIKPDSASAVAWMVIAGDGLHNLTDGFAIGAAFAISVWGGVSTTIAVFCHELPHEVGDFAMLLATGMGVKEAVLYNLLSSVLCFFGMAGGILLVGNTSEGEPVMSPWVFSVTAGIFIYLALVDMIPELTSSDRGPKHAGFRVALEVAGIVTGIFVMFLIAYNEETLHTFLQK